MSPNFPEHSDRRRSLLDDLARFAGGGITESSAQSSNEDYFKEHLPIAEHRRVLDRDTMLVLGGRGTGKSHLFDVLRRLEDPSALARPDKRPQPGGGADVYVAGYTAHSTDYPPHDVLQRCVAEDVERTATNLWVGLLAGILLRRKHAEFNPLKERLDGELRAALLDSLASPSRWLSLVDRHFADVSNALDRVDIALRERNQYVFVTYDDLDILAARVAQVYPLVRELLAFWLRSSRRWGNLRCKIFLRTDIFNADDLAFTDSSKLRPRSVTLKWNADNLYRLVLKRLLNRPCAADWRHFLGDAVPDDRIQEAPPWGVLPTTQEPHHKAALERLVGTYMGADPRRGATYSWFLNHLRDSHGEIVPRSFLKLFEFSAQRQDELGLPGSSHLLLPQQIMGALLDVSKDRIAELTNEEFPWIKRIQSKLKEQTVPMAHRDFRKLLREIDWGSGTKPPHVEPDRLMNYLLDLGILRETADKRDKRIHVPDIYLYGFGLKRKGGIRRPGR